MKKTVLCLLWIMLQVLAVTSVWSGDYWETLATSPGALESLALNASGDVCILEALRFTQLPAGQSEAVTRELPLSERIFLSPRGGVYASLQYEGQNDLPTAAKLTLYRSDGRMLWTLIRHPLNDVFLMENGGAVAVSRNLSLLENPIFFFSPSGELVKQLNVPAPGEVRISPSSDQVIINSGIEGALLFDAQGNRISCLGPAYRMSFSPDGHWIAILYGSQLTIFYDGQTAFNAELCSEIVRGAAFSPDNTYLATFTDHCLYLLQNPSGQVVFQRQLDPTGELSYTSVDVTRDASFLAVGVECDLGESIKGPERHPKGGVWLLDRTGVELYQTDVTYSRWNTTTPRVQFSPDGRQLLVLTRDEIRRTSVAELLGKDGE